MITKKIFSIPQKIRQKVPFKKIWDTKFHF